MFATALEPVVAGFAQDVMAGLTTDGPKTLPSSWLYDDVGSALFEVITLLPEYGLTRADASLLREAATEIVSRAGEPRRIVELGSGSGVKTRHILEAAAVGRTVDYLPIDISPAALNSCVDALRRIPCVHIRPVQSTYLEGIETALLSRRANEPVLLLFLGSTIGNFTPAEAIDFLNAARGKLSPGDCLLLGADLVKPREQLIAAYDDPLGVTAAFNLNLLARINRELGGEFVLSRFAHEARFDTAHSRIEMHLRSRVPQQVRIAALGCTVAFDAGETIWTESSHKFRQSDIVGIGARSGWRAVKQWVDREWGFAETLFSA